MATADGKAQPVAAVNSIEQERAALRRLAEGSASADVSPLIRRSTHVVLTVVWAVAILTALISAGLLVSHAKSHARLTAASLEQYAKRNVGLAAFVVDEYEEFLDARGSLEGLSDDPLARQKLRELNRRLPAGSIAALVLPDGNVAVGSEAAATRGVNLRDRRWFRAHVEEGRDSYVGPAILSRVSNRLVYTYSAAYRAPDGRLRAIINLGLPSDSLTGLLSPDQHGTSVALVQHEGPVVVAQPFDSATLGKVFPLPTAQASGDATFFGPVMGYYSVAAIRDVPDLGLYAVAALPMTTVLRPLMPGIAIGLTSLLILSFLLLRQSRLLQQKSAQVEQALADNKVLFQEVHHRVKNNLQVITSLLRLQADRLPPEMKPFMEEARNRVRAIALVHEQIYRTASPAVVQLDLFMDQLIQQLAASMIGGTASITTDLAPVAIPLDRAVPVAILATEAITNAIKHGLADGEGRIAVALRNEGGHNVIEVRDGGPGPAEAAEAGLGSRIMTALSRQIDGEWTLAARPEGGSLFTLSWPA